MLQISILLKDVEQDIIDIIVAELSEINFEGFEERENELVAYIAEENYNNQQLTETLTTIIGHTHFEITAQVLPQVNWNEEWEKNFDPVHFEDCIIRAPFHPKPEGIVYDIVIEPKMSFGTGHHATTYMMMQYLRETNFAGKTVLDMGCGTGVLAIMAKFKNASTVVAIDNDEWAYNNTVENIAKNNVSDIKVHMGDASLLGKEMFDVIIANINRNILLQDIAQYASVLKTGGTLLLSGFYKHDIPVIQQECERNNLQSVNFKENSDWVAVRFDKK